ncbi:MAG: SRPBCC domain-containing protein [Bacteroidota bacterium]|nr:SRPBCC domain-containing protein [Bacteroidota bacterium]MDP4246607.1 SRPBCC domain-containing protein [Bacteroidota bacterium]MDP4257168.1 SRPBCC domain-containing protein [Bacteroidota bacterium]
MTKNETVFSKDLPNNKLTVTRAFDAPPDIVWRAWTESEILDQWWAPKPYRTETKTMDFREGGFWLYCMVGPQGDRHWCRIDYVRIEQGKSMTTIDSFCDETGNRNANMPAMNWKKEFSQTQDGTLVKVEIVFNSTADMETIIKMGFQEGFTMGLGNLDHYLSTQFRMRKEMKTTNKARVTSYLNFPGKTEEAFNFYKQVFNGQFTGVGLRRFGDVELPAGIPPMNDADKRLIIHAELTIMGGYVLMATDAPESMGFTLQTGNNMHINLEPDSREETKRLFDALSEGGTVTMPLEDMFWGAYFGSCTDKYGINWMLHYQTAG